MVKSSKLVPLPPEMLGHQVMSGALKEREASEHPPTIDVDVRFHQPPDEESARYAGAVA
jgi:hypothetical protein